MPAREARLVQVMRSFAEAWSDTIQRDHMADRFAAAFKHPCKGLPDWFHVGKDTLDTGTAWHEFILPKWGIWDPDKHPESYLRQPLKPYQLATLDNLEKDVRTRRRGIVHLPTGSGKTLLLLEYIASCFRKHARSGGPPDKAPLVIWSAHLSTLRVQSLKALFESVGEVSNTERFPLWVTCAVVSKGGVSGGDLSSIYLKGLHIAFAITHTSARASVEKRSSLAWQAVQQGRPVILIVDECHTHLHGKNTYAAFEDFLDEFKGRDVRLIGASATPRSSKRTQNETLFTLDRAWRIPNDIVDAMRASRSVEYGLDLYVSKTIQDMIREGVTCKVENLQDDVLRLPKKLADDTRDLTDVRAMSAEQGSEWVSRMNRRFLSRPDVCQEFADMLYRGVFGTELRKLGAPELGKTIVFATSIRAADTIVGHLRDRLRSVKSVELAERVFVVHTGMNEYRQAEAISGFKRLGRAPGVIVNVDMLREGFDDPPIQTVFMARMVRSPDRFWQMLGRGTRGKGVGGTSVCYFADPIHNAELWGMDRGYDHRPYLGFEYVERCKGLYERSDEGFEELALKQAGKLLGKFGFAANPEKLDETKLEQKDKEDDIAREELSLAQTVSGFASGPSVSTLDVRMLLRDDVDVPCQTALKNPAIEAQAAVLVAQGNGSAEALDALRTWLGNVAFPLRPEMQSFEWGTDFDEMGDLETIVREVAHPCEVTGASVSDDVFVAILHPDDAKEVRKLLPTVGVNVPDQWERPEGLLPNGSRCGDADRRLSLAAADALADVRIGLRAKAAPMVVTTRDSRGKAWGVVGSGAEDDPKYSKWEDAIWRVPNTRRMNVPNEPRWCVLDQSDASSTVGVYTMDREARHPLLRKHLHKAIVQEHRTAYTGAKVGYSDLLDAWQRDLDLACRSRGLAVSRVKTDDGSLAANETVLELTDGGRRFATVDARGWMWDTKRMRVASMWLAGAAVASIEVWLKTQPLPSGDSPFEQRSSGRPAACGATSGPLEQDTSGEVGELQSFIALRGAPGSGGGPASHDSAKEEAASPRLVKTIMECDGVGKEQAEEMALRMMGHMPRPWSPGDRHVAEPLAGSPRLDGEWEAWRQRHSSVCRTLQPIFRNVDGETREWFRRVDEDEYGSIIENVRSIDIAICRQGLRAIGEQLSLVQSYTTDGRVRVFCQMGALEAVAFALHTHSEALAAQIGDALLAYAPLLYAEVVEYRPASEERPDVFSDIILDMLAAMYESGTPECRRILGELWLRLNSSLEMLLRKKFVRESVRQRWDRASGVRGGFIR